MWVLTSGGNVGCEHHVLFTCARSQTPESEVMQGCFASTIILCGCPSLDTLEGKDSQHS